MDPSQGQFLSGVGARIRRRRTELDLSARALAERAGLSPRFIAQVEAGQGNIAIGRLEKVARALEVPLATLLESPHPPGPRRQLERLLDGLDDGELKLALGLLRSVLGLQAPRSIAILGVRGAGKSSVGPPVAKALGMDFAELDELIEGEAGLGIGEIFALHGEPYYRRLEARCLREVLSGPDCVIALPGGIVTDEEAWGLARAGCFCVWLQATAEDHMARVLAQGDRRPSAGRGDAMAELRALLEARGALYAQAHASVDTSVRSLDEVVARVVELGRAQRA